jgi:hypothetical protein
MRASSFRARLVRRLPSLERVDSSRAVLARARRRRSFARRASMCGDRPTRRLSRRPARGARARVRKQSEVIIKSRRARDWLTMRGVWVNRH